MILVSPPKAMYFILQKPLEFSLTLLTTTTISVRFSRYRGGVAEWLNALVLKSSEGECPPRVRISPPPPVFIGAVERFILGVTLFVKLPDSRIEFSSFKN